MSGSDSQVLMWDLATGTLVAQFKGHSHTVHALCFSRDGAVLSSGGLDNKIKVWDVMSVLADQDTEVDVTVPSNIQV